MLICLITYTQLRILRTDRGLWEGGWGAGAGAITRHHSHYHKSLSHQLQNMYFLFVFLCKITPGSS